MGGEPGKQSRIASATPAATQPDVSRPSGIPGKATLAGALPTSAAAIGDRYIENREHCAAGVAGCFLTDTQRTRLVSAYQDQVGQAHAAYIVALEGIRFDRMTKKAEELPLLLTIALDVIAGQALAGLGRAIKALKAAAAPQIAAGDLSWMLQLQGGGGGESDRPSLTTLISGVSEPGVGFVIKAAVDEARRRIRTAAPTTEKAASLDYISHLQRNASIAFNRQRLDPPGYATDADMIVLFHSYQPELGHTAPDYKAALEEKIERYLASSTSRIGRHAATTQLDFDVQGNTARDTKVVWVKSSDRPVPVLHYYKRDFANSQNEHTMGDVGITPLQPLDDRFKIDRPVEIEFVDVAIAKHRAAWGAEPETRQVASEMVPRWRPTRAVGDLNQYVPANNPDFQPATGPASTPATPPADPVVVRGPLHVK